MAAAAVLALSAASSADVVAARSFSTSADYRVASRDIRVDALLATVAAAATWATASCISSWAHSTQSSCVVWGPPPTGCRKGLP
jgi:hypothetical protein